MDKQEARRPGVFDLLLQEIKRSGGSFFLNYRRVASEEDLFSRSRLISYSTAAELNQQA
jgi:hypothetical protein